jgi:hypothetical protein
MHSTAGLHAPLHKACMTAHTSRQGIQVCWSAANTEPMGQKAHVACAGAPLANVVLEAGHAAHVEAFIAPAAAQHKKTGARALTSVQVPTLTRRHGPTYAPIHTQTCSHTFTHTYQHTNKSSTIAMQGAQTNSPALNSTHALASLVCCVKAQCPFNDSRAHKKKRRTPVLYFPLSQAEHVASPTPLPYVPGLHNEHDVDPVAGVALPLRKVQLKSSVNVYRNSCSGSR